MKNAEGTIMIVNIYLLLGALQDTRERRIKNSYLKIGEVGSMIHRGVHLILGISSLSEWVYGLIPGLLLIIIAMANPSPDLLFLDKMLIQAEMADTEAIICFNKSDLVTPDEAHYTKTYTDLGYRVFITSTYTGEGIDDLRNAISGKVISVCGFSGVGKSSILNTLLGSENQEVGEVSRKLSRGKHTTREVSLIEYKKGSYLADTPGFSSLALPETVTKDNLKNCFHEFEEYEAGCRFSDCVHTSPKFCGVCDALEKGEISLSRYNNYKSLFESLKDKKEWK